MVFLKPRCPYCLTAQEVLSEYNFKPGHLECVDISGHSDMDKIQDYLMELTGARTVNAPLLALNAWNVEVFGTNGGFKGLNVLGAMWSLCGHVETEIRGLTSCAETRCVNQEARASPSTGTRWPEYLAQIVGAACWCLLSVLQVFSGFNRSLSKQDTRDD